MMRIAVVGGGPAGMMAAIQAAASGAAVTLYEGNEKLGKKLYITGKGRCNITNTASKEQFFEKVVRNHKFFYSAFSRYDNEDIIKDLESWGLPTKVERGGRVFPKSDKSSDVIAALAKRLRDLGVVILLNQKVQRAEKTGEEFVVTAGDSRCYDALILATGGKSYPSTGADGSGYRLAQAFGHTVTDILPSLVPLETVEQWPASLQGLSLKNVTLKAYEKKKLVYEELGEMLFTHFGVSGPLVLSASCYLPKDAQGCGLSIDLKPGLTLDMLDKRLQRDLEQSNKKQFQNALSGLLPSALIPVMIELSRIHPETPACEITREQRLLFGELTKALPLTVKAVRSLKEAVITRGGINTKEVCASTMESKLVKGLYFAGELLDLDAQTGGYNLQIAYSTGVLAGECAAWGV